MRSLYPRDALIIAAQAQTLDLLPTPNTAPLRAVLERLWADSWATGRHGAELQVAKASVRKDKGGSGTSPTVDVITNWSSWEPGNISAAILASDGGFAAALDRADITLEGITSTGIDRMGTILSEGLLNGDSPDAIARGLMEVLDDPDRAELISATESARFQTEATFASYTDMSVTRWDWLTTDGACPTCVDIEARNPHDMGEQGPPAHPRCRCAASPVVDI